MKLATFEDSAGVSRIGAVLDAGASVVDFAAAHQRVSGKASEVLTDMLAFIDGGERALALARALVSSPPEEAVVPLSSVRLLAPLPRPRQLRDFLCFEAHLVNANKTIEQRTGRKVEIPPVLYEQPIYYKSNRFSVIGTDTDVRWPHYAQVLDYELELACIIGKKGCDITAYAATDHIFGYTIFNDVSARDIQGKEMSANLGPAKGKDFDTGNVLGPWIVTSDEIDPYNLTMTARVNGEEWSRGRTNEMLWKFEDLIAHVSMAETMYPGEVLGSGTVGTGCGLELNRFPQPGDVVELEVEGIGVLRNRFVKNEQNSRHSSTD